MENSTSNNMKIAIVVFSVLTLLLLAIAVTQENIAVQWKDYQNEYRLELMAQSETDLESEAADIPIKLRQEFLAELNRTDRCTTCHIGIETPKMNDAKQPIRAHSGTVLKYHPPGRFGCTVCHDGQGLATTADDAHGEVEFWLYPLLRGDLVYTSCGRCHYENDLYGAEYDLYTVGATPPPLMKDELASAVPGGDAVARGKQLVLSSGCLGCHKYRGRGGTLGPNITHIGDKQKHDFDFTNVEGKHTVEQWLLEHFKNPEKLSPGTLMPNSDLSDRQTHDLTQYMMSLHKKKMPASHTPVPPRRKGESASGLQIYTTFCSSCHGSDGQGSTVRDPLLAVKPDVPPELMVPSLNNPDTLAMVSDGYLHSIITNGRPNTSMVAWGLKSGGGFRPEELSAVVEAIRSWELPGPDATVISSSRGDVFAGRLFYQRNCSSCHGVSGEGGIGTTLSSPSFLAIASDDFLSQALIEGRPNTAMPSWKQFDSQQLSDIIAYLRGWHVKRNDKQTTLQMISATKKHSGVSAAIGHILYSSNCVMCHGPSGEGDLAPSLSTQEFLTVVDNEYLYDTLSLGRPGTGMPAWQHFSNDDMASLLAFLRTWQKLPSGKLQSGSLKGDWDLGNILYQRMCSGCHGLDAEGGVGPQLSNPVFLKTTSDAMLEKWIAEGKSGTQMVSFTKKDQGMVDLSPGQIRDIVSYIRSLERRPRVSVMRSPNGRPELGELWYAVMCSSCHGEQGEGASGPSLANRGLLAAASDGYLLGTLALGRDGTEMRPVKKGPQSILSLSSDQVNDLVAYLRSWEFELPSDGIPHNFVIPWDLVRGERLYQSNCSGCHGINGKAELYEPGLSAWAPELNNEGFLAAATDGFNQATIVRGRTGTAMLPFGQGHQGMLDLTTDEIDDIVAYIRRWSTQTISPMTIPAERSSLAGERSGEIKDKK